MTRLLAAPLAILLLSCAPKGNLETPPLPVVPVPPPTAPADDDPVVLDGIPGGVDPAWAARVHPYTQARGAALRDVAPDGESVLIGTSFGETSQLHRVDMAMGARTQLTFREERVRGGSFRPGDPDQIVFLSDQGGDEQYQYFLLDLGASETTRLTDGTSRHRSWTWAPDGQSAVFMGTARNDRDFDLYRWTPDGTELLLELEGSWGVSGWSPDGRTLSMWQYRSITDTAIHLYDLEAGELLPLSPPDAPGAYRGAAFLDGADTLLMPSDRAPGQEAGEFRQLWRIERPSDDPAADPSDAVWTNLTADIPWDVEELVVTDDGQRAAFVVNEGGVGALHLYEADSGVISRVDGVPTGLVYGLAFDDAGDDLFFTVNGATSPGDVYHLDLDDLAVTRWTQSEVGGLDPDRLVAPTLVSFQSFDGAEIPAFVYRPPDADGPVPVVVYIHGGPESQFRPYFSSTVQMLVGELGVAVVAPNVRGSAGYGRTWLTMDNGRKREDSVKDIGALLDWIATRDDLDAERVAVMGGSYGGYMVLASLVHYSDRLVAGIDSVGIANFVTFLENTREYRRDLRRVEYGDERDPEMRAFLEEISPVNSADRIDAALFVVHGANDPRVPVGEAEQIVQAVRENGRDAWYMLARNEGHGMSRRENRATYRVLTAQFLAEQLGVGVD